MDAATPHNALPNQICERASKEKVIWVFSSIKTKDTTNINIKTQSSKFGSCGSLSRKKSSNYASMSRNIVFKPNKISPCRLLTSSSYLVQSWFNGEYPLGMLSPYDMIRSLEGELLKLKKVSLNTENGASSWNIRIKNRWKACIFTKAWIPSYLLKENILKSLSLVQVLMQEFAQQQLENSPVDLTRLVRTKGKKRQDKDCRQEH